MSVISDTGMECVCERENVLAHTLVAVNKSFKTLMHVCECSQRGFNQDSEFRHFVENSSAFYCFWVTTGFFFSQISQD